MSTLCIDFGGTEIKLGLLDGPRASRERCPSQSGQRRRPRQRVRDAAGELIAAAGDSHRLGRRNRAPRRRRPGAREPRRGARQVRLPPAAATCAPG